MSSEAYEIVIDFDDVGEKRAFIERLSRAKGKWRVRLNRARPGMTYQQQKYYFAAHVTLLWQYLSERNWKGTKAELHEMMKHKFLRSAVVEPRSGKVLGYTMNSTQKLSTIEMADFMENVAQWLAEQFGIVVPPPDVYATTRKEIADGKSSKAKAGDRARRRSRKRSKEEASRTTRGDDPRRDARVAGSSDAAV